MNSVESLFRVVLEVSWRASWLMLAVLALRALLRRHLPARVIFWAWIAVAVRLLWPFAVPANWSPFNLATFIHRADSAVLSSAMAGSATPGAAERRAVASERLPVVATPPPLSFRNL